MLRDRGDVAEARAVLVDGLAATAADARRSLLAPANHHRRGAGGDRAAAAARLRGPLAIAANSLVVLDDFLADDPEAARRELDAVAASSGAPFGSPETPPTADELAPLGRPPAALHVVTQVYEPADPRRRAELAFVLMRNLANARVGHVHVLLEDPRDGPFVLAAARALGRRRRPDLTVRNATGGRLTFAEAFAYASSELAGEVVVVANADVFFTEDAIARLGDPATLDLDGRVLALLRWEWTCGFDAAPVAALAEVAVGADARRCARLRPRTDSQDAWVFRAPLAVAGPPVELGRARCDNHVAAVLYAAGYDVASPLALGPLHVQGVAGIAGPPPKTLRSYTSPTEIKGAARYVPLDDRWLF